MLKHMERNMPTTMSVYLTPEFRPVFEVLDGIAARDRIGMSTLVKRALTEWATDHGLDPTYVMQRSMDAEIRAAVGAKPSCRFRLITSPKTIVCKAEHSGGEQKALAACVDCELYDPREG